MRYVVLPTYEGGEWTSNQGRVPMFVKDSSQIAKQWINPSRGERSVTPNFVERLYIPNYCNVKMK